MKKAWFSYIVLCSDNTLYTGITNDLDRRIEEHNSSDRGAKYTRSRRPVKLIYFEEFDCRSDAAKREAAIKNMRIEEKRELLTD
jgi:putative endonuclease